MSTFGFDPVSTFWKMLLNAQELNQLALKAFLNTQKVQQSQQSVEQLLQEFMVYAGDNTSIALAMLQSLSKANNPEEYLKIQERLITEYSEKNLEHTKKFLNLYHTLWHEMYHNAKQGATECSEAVNDVTRKFTEKFKENVNKFAETAATMTSSCCNKGNNNPGSGNKRHQNATEHQ